MRKIEFEKLACSNHWGFLTPCCEKTEKLEKALKNIIKERDDKNMDVVSLCFEIEDARKVLEEPND